MSHWASLGFRSTKRSSSLLPLAGYPILQPRLFRSGSDNASNHSVVHPARETRADDLSACCASKSEVGRVYLEKNWRHVMRGVEEFAARGTNRSRNQVAESGELEGDKGSVKQGLFECSPGNEWL